MESMALAERRLTRVQAKALTRRRLLDAARAVFLRDGFHGTTVDKIADAAGFTKGAVYSAFASKADLFLALYEERQAERAAVFTRLRQRRTESDRHRAVSEVWTEVLRGDLDWLLVLVEFWTFAARDAGLRARFAALHARVRETIAASLAGAAHDAGRELPFPATAIARAFMALGNGFALEAFLDGSVVRDGYEVAHAALSQGMEATVPASAPPRRPGKGKRR
jgi:AcrR family transcriptional regulator